MIGIIGGNGASICAGIGSSFCASVYLDKLLQLDDEGRLRRAAAAAGAAAGAAGAGGTGSQLPNGASRRKINFATSLPEAR
jgi:hypothetical protein